MRLLGGVDHALQRFEVPALEVADGIAPLQAAHASSGRSLPGAFTVSAASPVGNGEDFRAARAPETSPIRLNLTPADAAVPGPGIVPVAPRSPHPDGPRGRGFVHTG